MIIEITDGYYDAVKTEMLEAKKLAAKYIKEIKRTEKDFVKSGCNPRYLGEHMRRLWLTKTAIVEEFTVTKVLPVKIDGLIYNGKLIEDFAKKVKDADILIEHDLDKRELHIDFGFHFGSQNSGRFTLLPLSEVFETTLSRIPEATFLHPVRA